MKIILSVLALPTLAALALWAAVAASSPLTVFSALVPQDAGVDLVAEGVAYGPDPRQRLDVYRPRTAGSDLPVIVFCYGGAWDSGARGYYGFVGRAFAAAGFLTIVYDYRLVPQARFPAFVEDAAAAIAWASRMAGHYGGDGRHVFIVGHSAGAYNLALAVLDPHYLSAQGLGPGAVAGVAALAGPFDFLPFDDPATIAAFGSAPEPAATQPVTFASAAAPPFLLVTGDADRTVYPRNSIRLAERLTAAGGEARLLVLAGLSHTDVLTAIAWPLRWRAPVLAEVTGFFRAIQARAKRS